MKRGALGSVLVVAALAAAAPASAAIGPEHSLRLRGGIFTPDGDAEYFTEAEQDFTGKVSDLEDFVGGIDYRYDFGGHVGLMISGDVYEGTWDRAYRDFEDNFGNEIEHRASLEIDSLTAGVVIDIAPERSPVVPYVGAGGGLYSYRLEESGDFIDFTSPDFDIFDAQLVAEGETFGYYFLVGLEVPLTPYFSIFGEGRWDNAEDELGEDFDGFGDLDLSGRRVMGGISWSF
jgi:opacity protein-like surface antigen